MSYNLREWAKDLLLGQADKVPPELKMARMKLCESCDELSHAIPFTTGICKQCGCFVAMKTDYVKSSCPLLKW